MVRDFKLVLRADGKGSQREREFRDLERLVSAERAEGGLYNLSSEPLVTYTPLGTYPVLEPLDHYMHPPMIKFRILYRLDGWGSLNL